MTTVMGSKRLPLILGSAFLTVLTGCGSSSSSDETDTVPGAPAITSVTAGDASASVIFAAPGSDGGVAITSYTATCTASSATTQTGTASASPIELSNLTNGTTYSCSVTATNSVGTGAASAAVSVTPTASTATNSTAAVDCPYSDTYTGEYSTSGTLTTSWSWTCDDATRSLLGDGLPNHEVGTFPNPGNGNTILATTISASMTLTPTLGTTNTFVGGPGGASVYARNSVKFDPGTGGACPDSMTATTDCDLGNGTGTWRIEALGQDTFDFGEDANNAHVQPTGEYHYHGIPEGLLTNAGVSDSNRQMVHVGWASDGFPVYARYCYTDAMDASSDIKVCEGSFELDTVPDTNRPSTDLVPLGTFVQDWAYSAGTGDLDDCNGRTGVTPEFPNGIYYYMATDSYPYFSRCIKGN